MHGEALADAMNNKKHRKYKDKHIVTQVYFNLNSFYFNLKSSYFNLKHRLLHIWTVRCFDQTDIGGPKLLHFARHLNR